MILVYLFDIYVSLLEGITGYDSSHADYIFMICYVNLPPMLDRCQTICCSFLLL